MPSVAPETPRKMLPPPMVSATSTPISTTSFTSCAMAVSVFGEMPYLPSPMSASPDSLRRMRLYRGFGLSARSLGMLGAFYPTQPGRSRLRGASGARSTAGAAAPTPPPAPTSPAPATPGAAGSSLGRHLHPIGPRGGSDFQGQLVLVGGLRGAAQRLLGSPALQHALARRLDGDLEELQGVCEVGLPGQAAAAPFLRAAQRPLGHEGEPRPLRDLAGQPRGRHQLGQHAIAIARSARLARRKVEQERAEEHRLAGLAAALHELVERRQVGEEPPPAFLRCGVVERCQRREEERERARGAQELEGAGRRAAAEDLEGLLQEPGRRAARELRRVPAHGGEGLGLDGEAEPRGEADGAQRPDRILLHPDLGIADGGDAVRLQIRATADVVDHLAGEDVVEEPVHREVAAPRVLLGRAEDVVAGDEEVARLVAHLVVGGGVGGVLPEGGDLQDLPAAEVDVRQPEPPADEPAIAEGGPHLARVRARRDVEVLRRVAEQDVADAAADEVGLVPDVAQPREDADGVLVEAVLRDLRRVRRRGQRCVERESALGLLVGPVAWIAISDPAARGGGLASWVLLGAAGNDYFGRLAFAHGAPDRGAPAGGIFRLAPVAPTPSGFCPRDGSSRRKGERQMRACPGRTWSPQKRFRQRGPARLGFEVFWRREELRLHGLEAERLADGRKRAAVKWAGAELLQGGEVLGGRVALVAGEAIAGVLGVMGGHHRVPGGLRDDARRGDGEAERVAVDDPLLRDGHLLQAAGIDEEVLRRHRKPLHGSAQRQEAGVVDVDRVDLLHAGEPHRPRHRGGLDLDRQPLAILPLHLLRVVDAARAEIARQDDGRRHHRSGERRHSGLVHAGDAGEALLPERRLVAQEVPEPLPLGPILAPAALHCLVDRARAGPDIVPQRLLAAGGERPPTVNVARPQLRHAHPADVLGPHRAGIMAPAAGGRQRAPRSCRGTAGRRRYPPPKNAKGAAGKRRPRPCDRRWGYAVRRRRTAKTAAAMSATAMRPPGPPLLQPPPSLPTRMAVVATPAPASTLSVLVARSSSFGIVVWVTSEGSEATL